MCYAMDALNNYDDDRQQLMTLEEMTAEVRGVNEQNGWFNSERTFGDDIALLTTEVGETYDAFRQWGLADATGANGGDQSAIPKPEGVGSELADIFIRLLDTCDRAGIDLRAEYVRKIAYNRTRGYHHGGKTL